MYLYVKWNSFGRGLLAGGLAIKACRASPWPLPERRPAPPQAARLCLSGGRGQGKNIGRVLSEGSSLEYRRLRCLRYIRSCS